MKGFPRICAASAAGFFAVSMQCAASAPAAQVITVNGAIHPIEAGAPVPKAASTRTLGSRATVTSSNTVYGGFEIAATTTIYILVRGNSLGTLGVTQAYLDAPRVRIYDALGQDLATQSGFPGVNYCQPGDPFQSPTINYYANVRGQPANAFDACYAAVFPAGVYTFSVTPSIPGVTTATEASVPTSGEMLFEVTLGP